MRGGVSTGFRAPTPGQQNALNVQTTIDPTTLELVDSATVPSTFVAAGPRGGKPLEPEESVHATAGVVIDTGPFTLTADYFNVDISDRLSLSQVLTLTEEERELLLSQGITSARNLSFFRFFINDFSTRTAGIDVVSTWTPLALDGDTSFSFTLNYTDTEVTEESDLLSPADVLAIERGVPRLRWNFAVNQQVGPVSLLGRLSHYGKWIDYYYTRLWVDPAPPVQDSTYIVDFEASIPIAADTTLAIGAQNMFDVLSSGARWARRRPRFAVQPGDAVGPERRLLLRPVQLPLGTIASRRTQSAPARCPACAHRARGSRIASLRRSSFHLADSGGVCGSLVRAHGPA